jgi:tetratricopeptide (TPR) repeat protein
MRARTLLLAVGLIAVAAPAALAQAQPQAQQALPVFSTSRLYPTEADFNRAVQPYQRAIAARAQDARAHYWLGYAHVYAYRTYLLGAAPYASGYGARAIQSLTEAIRLDQTMLDAYLALHDAYQLTGQTEKANEITVLMFQRTRPKWLPAVPAP